MTLVVKLRPYVVERQRDWDFHVNQLTYAYDVWVSTSRVLITLHPDLSLFSGHIMPTAVTPLKTIQYDDERWMKTVQLHNKNDQNSRARRASQLPHAGKYNYIDRLPIDNSVANGLTIKSYTIWMPFKTGNSKWSKVCWITQSKGKIGYQILYWSTVGNSHRILEPSST